MDFFFISYMLGYQKEKGYELLSFCYYLLLEYGVAKNFIIKSQCSRKDLLKRTMITLNEAIVYIQIPYKMYAF